VLPAVAPSFRRTEFPTAQTPRYADSRALSFGVVDKNSAAMTDVDAAAKRIIEEAEKSPGDDRIYIASDMVEAIVAALRKAHPRRFILARTIVVPSGRADELGRLTDMREAVPPGVSKTLL
jgi:hypothetical protein